MAGDHRVVVVGVEEIRARLVLQLPDELAQAGHVLREADLGTVAPRRVDLQLRRALGHGDRDLRARRLGRVRDRGRGVPRAHRHDAFRTLLLGQARKREHRPAGLERARALEELSLEIRRRADPLAESAAGEHRGPVEVRRRDRAGALDVCEGDRHPRLNCGPGRDRTCDQQIMSPPLLPLSYGP